MGMQSAAFARLQHHLPNDNCLVLIELLRCYFGHNYPLWKLGRFYATISPCC
jgi:hypothetical protein